MPPQPRIKVKPQNYDDLIDLEQARNEARYVPMEVAASLAMGVMRSQAYTEHSTQVQQAWSDGTPITQDGCIGVAVVDGFEPDRWDYVGAALCLVGGGVIMLVPRG